MPAQGTPPERFNFAHATLERNAARGDKAAYIDDLETLSYGELDLRVRAAAAAYIALGLRREERVLLCLHDTVDFPVAFLGALYAGVVPVAVNTLLTADDYAYMLAHSRAQALLVSGALLPTLQQALARGGHDVKHVDRFARGSVRRGKSGDRARLCALAERAVADGDARGHRRRRHGVLALFVRLDRTAEGHRAHARQPALDRRALRHAGPGRDREATSCFPRPSSSSPMVSAMR